MEDLVQRINEAWGWSGLVAAKVLAINTFGNLLIEDKAGKVWRITPEDPSCALVASDPEQFATVLTNKDFSKDWEMATMVDLAAKVVGALARDRVYCLKVPSLLGGPYEADNLGSIGLLELIGVAGQIAEEIDGLPDGAQIALRVINGSEQS
jgi:hypothetical protein